jgi:hypothetical protein
MNDLVTFLTPFLNSHWGTVTRVLVSLAVPAIAAVSAWMAARGLPEEAVQAWDGAALAVLLWLAQRVLSWCNDRAKLLTPPPGLRVGDALHDARTRQLDP